MNKDILELEKEIDGLDEIKEWSQKIQKMKELQERINLQKIKINSLFESINSGEIKKIKKSKKDKDLNLDELLKEFETCENVDDKIKLFNQIQYLIKESELELFEE